MAEMPAVYEWQCFQCEEHGFEPTEDAANQAAWEHYEAVHPDISL